MLFTVATHLLAEPGVVLPRPIIRLVQDFRFYAAHARIPGTPGPLAWIPVAAALLADRYYGCALAETLEWVLIQRELRDIAGAGPRAIR